MRTLASHTTYWLHQVQRRGNSKSKTTIVLPATATCTYHSAVLSKPSETVGAVTRLGTQICSANRARWGRGGARTMTIGYNKAELINLLGGLLARRCWRLGTIVSKLAL